jgi:uncharacterized protein (DUF58 family)
VTQIHTLVPESRSSTLMAKGRFGFAFGQRFYLFALIGLLWLAPAFSEGDFVWALVAWNVLLALLWVIDFVRMPSPGELSARRDWSKPLLLDTATKIFLRVENLSARRVHIEVVEDSAVELSDVPLSGQLDVDPKGSGVMEYACSPRKRGDAPMGKTFFRYESPWGIAQRWAIADLSQTVRVYPSTGRSAEDSLYLLRSRRIEIEKRFRRKQGLGREFESLREFRQGDSYRDISWTATARRGKIVVREFQTERSQPIWLMVDCGRLMRMKVGDLSKLDHAISAALNVAQIALLSGDRVGLMAYGMGPQRWVALGKGERQLRSLLEELALVKEEASEANHLQAAARFMAAQSQRSLVVWLTDLADTAMTPEVVEGASVVLNRHLVLFSVIDNPALREIAGKSPVNAEDLYRSTAAHEVLLRRESLIAGLRARGAHTLEVGAKGLSAAVVEQYFQIKERGLI